MGQVLDCGNSSVLDCGNSSNYTLNRHSQKKRDTDVIGIEERRGKEEGEERISAMIQGMYSLSGVMERVLGGVGGIGGASRLASYSAQSESIRELEWKNPEGLLTHSEEILRMLHSQAILIEEKMNELRFAPIENQLERLLEESQATLLCFRAHPTPLLDPLCKVVSFDSLLQRLHQLELLKQEAIQTHNSVLQSFAIIDSPADKSPIAPSSEDRVQTAAVMWKKTEPLEEVSGGFDEMELLEWLRGAGEQVAGMTGLFQNQRVEEDGGTEKKGENAVICSIKSLVSRISSLQLLVSADLQDTDELLNRLLTMISSLSQRLPDSEATFQHTSQELIAKSGECQGKPSLIREKIEWIGVIVKEVNKWIEGKLNVLELYNSRIARLTRSMNNAPYK